MWNVNIGRFGGFNDIDAILDFDFRAVDGNFGHWWDENLTAVPVKFFTRAENTHARTARQRNCK
jgi:hypothetical protein